MASKNGGTATKSGHRREIAVGGVRQSKPIAVPRPRQSLIEAVLVGIEPGLLINPFDRKAEEQLLASMQKGTAKRTRADKDPEREYAARLAAVRLPEDDTYWLDIRAFKKAMCRGAKSVDKLNMTDVRGGVFVVQDSVINQKPVAHIAGVAERYSCHASNKGGSPDYRTRVLLPAWRYTLRFLVDTSILSVDQSMLCLVNAGTGVGVGDWRPEKDGVHGRWTVESAGAVVLQSDE